MLTEQRAKFLLMAAVVAVFAFLIVLVFRIDRTQPPNPPPIDTVIPPPPSLPPINISYDQFKSALDKWNSQKVEEYEVDIHIWEGMTEYDVALRVSDEGNALLELDVTPVQTPEPRFLDSRKENTVEGMFKDIEGMISKGEPMHKDATGILWNPTGAVLYVAYEVEFDDQFGYPIYIQSNPIAAPDSVIEDGGWWKRVNNLKIIKRSADP